MVPGATCAPGRSQQAEALRQGEIQLPCAVPDIVRCTTYVRERMIQLQQSHPVIAKVVLEFGKSQRLLQGGLMIGESAAKALS